MNTPVAFFIFNRPDTTVKVFEAIRRVAPRKLLVVADGPRPERIGEAEKCAATRAIIDSIDWGCELLTNYSNENLGCKRRVSTGLDWVFNTVEEAILLEDDVLPHPTFFRYCEELLNYYRNNEQVMAISGQNVQFGRKRTDCSYYFSQYFHCWGWASWRRAWRHCDVQMKQWPGSRDKHFLEKLFSDKRAVRYWKDHFQATYNGHFDTWDYQWMFACWINNGLTVVPDINLVSNIGFGAEATHTTVNANENLYANMLTESMSFPLKHPCMVTRNIEADNFTQSTLFTPNLATRFKSKFLRVLPKLKRMR
jgi:hypothetical protein